MSLLIKRRFGWTRYITRPMPGAPAAPYLNRHTLRHQGASGTNPWRVYLHQFLAPDFPTHHNHPSRWSFSLILWGSYTEEILVPDPYAPLDHAATREVQPGIWATPFGMRVVRRRVRWWNWIPASRYHRIVELHPGPGARGVWTLFTCGPLTGEGWGFYVPGKGHVDHKDFEHTKVVEK